MFLVYSLLKLMVRRSRLYKRVKSDQTIGVECRLAFMGFLQSIIQWVYQMVINGIPVKQVMSVKMK